MATPSDIPLTGTNYSSWKTHMEGVLQSRGLDQITLGNKLHVTNANKKMKWDGKSDEARGLINMSISHDLWFHLQGINKLDKAWEKLETVFDKHNDIWGHHIETQLVTLNPSDFYCIQGYLSQYKTIKLLVEECNIKNHKTMYLLYYF